MGDYTRSLAAEYVRQNHSCLLLALNDPFVSQPTESTERLAGILIPILRLPNALSWKQRSALAADFQSRHHVDWISLQFVCYGFNCKGIVMNLADYLEPIILGRPVHVMFHELWIGVGEASPFKRRIVGRIQRHYITRMLRQLKPRLITTSNSFYRSLLNEAGIHAIEMPLAGSIPIRSATDKLLISDALLEAGICDEQGNHPDRQVGLFFGALYQEWKAEPFMNYFIAARKKEGVRPCLISAGRAGKPGQILWAQLQKDYAETIDFIALGECDVEQVAVLMQIADFGLATTPEYLLGKSSSVAVMLDHGLPVIVTRLESKSAAFLPDDPLVHLCDNALAAKLKMGLPRRAPRNGVKFLAQNFTRKLADASGSTATQQSG